MPYIKLFRWILFLISAKICASQGLCGTDVRFASYYADNMVLQMTPTRASVWGYAAQVGDVVAVNLTGNGLFLTYETEAVEGMAGAPVWKISLDPIQQGGAYSITMMSGNCTISLENIMFGDVWFCSGQSNMVYWLQTIDNPEEELADAVNYPDIRIFKIARSTANETQEDLLEIAKQWSVPNEENVGEFSALCWLYGVRLYNALQRPIGLIDSAWGGTRIEAWSSPEALDVCFPDGVMEDEGKNEASVLYNAMIHPFLQMPIYGAIWYQGESNFNNPERYGCAVQQMVADWRASWFNNTPSMSSQFPFGFAQLAPNNPNDARRGLPSVRWAQTYGYGYAPNDLLPGFFMAVAIDTPDFDNPLGSIHPRYKRQVADRLALSGLAVAYGDESMGLWQGPLPTQFYIESDTLVITLADEQVELEAMDTNSTVHYEVCCSSNNTMICENEGDGINTRWELTEFESFTFGKVMVSVPCDLTFEFVTGVRYAWRASPCPVLEECAIYSVENSLPAPPFIYNGLIQAIEN